MKKNSAAFPTDDDILSTLCGQSRPINLDSMLRILGLRRGDKFSLTQALERLAKNGSVLRQRGGMWKIPACPPRLVAGRYKRLPDGEGIILPLDGSKSLLVRVGDLHDAWEGDTVRAAILSGKEHTAKIVDIVERAQKEIPAHVLKRHGKKIICKSTGLKPPVDFQCEVDPRKFSVKALKPGALVILAPERNLGGGLWQARLKKIYDNEDSVLVQEEIVKSAHQVPLAFPDLAISQAEALPSRPVPEDMAERIDMRHIGFVTIDGEDARDFDDAIHVEKAAGGWLLRVAIADVSHYVRPDHTSGSLDDEALKRGNSWYFPASVEPMLPQKLSNGLCSLNPGEDRLAILAEIHLDSEGKPHKTTFAPVVMRSAGRLTYQQVGNFFEGAGDAYLPEPTRSMLEDAHDLYRVLARKRHQRGSLDFDLREPDYSLDESGRLLEIRTAQRNDAHRMIEEFMIAANEAVASRLGQGQTPFPYRIHPKPEPEKLETFWGALRSAAMEILPAGLKSSDLENPLVLQAILEKARGLPCEFIVNRLCLRSMPQARYQTENAGHFGLASCAYCHFTSPIRRYADLLTHRALKAELFENRPAKTTAELDDICAHLNRREREAIDCEREMSKRLACLELKNHIGEVVTGTISGVTDFGIFVEFDHMAAEGFIRIRDLGNDYFELDQSALRLIGSRTGHIWQLGQRIKAKIMEVDQERLEARLVPLSLPPSLGACGQKGYHNFHRKDRFRAKSRAVGKNRNSGQRQIPGARKK